MKRYFGSLILLFILLVMPSTASTNTVLIYVSNENGSSVDVIDTATNEVVQRIEGIAIPDGVVSSPDGRRAYIPDQAEEVLDVVDTRTGAIIKKVPLSGIPNLPAITKDGKRVLVAIWALKSEANVHGAVDIIDTTSLQRTKTIRIKGPGHDIFTSRDDRYAVVGSSSMHREDQFMTAIDLQTEQPIWDLQFDLHGLRPSRTAGSVLGFAIESGPDGSTSRIFVQLNGLHGFAVVDFANHKEVARYELPVAPFGWLSQPTHGIGISPDGKTLVVCSRGSNNVFLYSLPELKLLGQVRMPEIETTGSRGPFGRGSDPHWVAFTPDSKTVYVPLAVLKSVSAIEMKSMKVVARIPVGDLPRHVATVVMPDSLQVTASIAPPSEPLLRKWNAKWIAQLPSEDTRSMKAKSIIVANCQWCHALDRIVISRHSKGEWKDLVDTMVKLGSSATQAQTPFLSPDKVTDIVDYLAANFKPAGSK